MGTETRNGCNWIRKCRENHFCQSLIVDKECDRTVPTVGVNVEKFKKGNLSLKLWDLGGQVQYRPEWTAYAKTCNMLVFIIDSSEPDTISFCKKELFNVLE